MAQLVSFGQRRRPSVRSHWFTQHLATAGDIWVDSQETGGWANSSKKSGFQRIPATDLHTLLATLVFGCWATRSFWGVLLSPSKALVVPDTRFKNMRQNYTSWISVALTHLPSVRVASFDFATRRLSICRLLGPPFEYSSSLYQSLTIKSNQLVNMRPRTCGNDHLLYKKCVSFGSNAPV